MNNIMLPYVKRIKVFTVCKHMVQHMVSILPYAAIFLKLSHMLTNVSINVTIL